MAERPYRRIPTSHGACPVCGEVVRKAYSKARIRQPVPLYVHGPRSARCPGSGQPEAPWVVASGLPTWDEMSDLDRGCALMHVWKRSWEGGPYACVHYPARYREHPRLVGLDREDANRHAVHVAGLYAAARRRLGDEFDRLYDIALDYERKQMPEVAS